MNTKQMKKAIDDCWINLQTTCDSTARADMALYNAYQKSLEVEKSHRNFMSSGPRKYALSASYVSKYFVLKHTFKGPDKLTVRWSDVIRYRPDVTICFGLHQILKSKKRFNKAFKNTDFTSIDYVVHICK